MDQTVSQLGGLLLSSVPTIICFVIVLVLYRTLVHKALTQVLEERHARTEGAIAKAKADVAAAEAKTAEYEARLRAARLQIYKAQEQRQKKVAEVRAAALQEARNAANARVQQERAALEKQTNDAKAQLQGQAETLAQQIIRAILKPTSAPAGTRA